MVGEVVSSCADESVMGVSGVRGEVGVGVSGVSGVRGEVRGAVDAGVMVSDGSGVMMDEEIGVYEAEACCVTASFLVSVMLSSRMMRSNRVVCPPSSNITSRDSRNRREGRCAKW
jgi:hypothetical protein